MIVHTANAFLMNQFSQGRLSVDTIKRTIDAWKSKGRPTVREFMYDQATQRELIVANQHSIRFHSLGNNSSSETRVNSMLYGWKNTCNTMAIRTFCYPDTVVLKLFFDIEQTLELLGAADSILLHFQRLRAFTNELIRLARLKRDALENPSSDDRGASRTTRSSENSGIYGALGDPYGGLKLVPDGFVEQH